MMAWSPCLAAGLASPGLLAAGAALAAIPIVIHFLNRRRFKVVPWAAMGYLLAAMRKNRRRLRFEQWLLLAVRCAVLALMGLALARPIACERSTLAHLAQRSGLHVIVIDDSLSMAYRANRPDAPTHFDQAKRLAKGIIDRLGGGESVAVIAAGAPARAVVAPASAGLDAVADAVGRMARTDAGTDLPGALAMAVDVGRAWRGSDRFLYILTDGTRAAWTGAGAESLKAIGPELAKLYRINEFALGVPDQWNQAVVSVRPAARVLTRTGDGTLLADVAGYGPPADAAVHWSVDDVAVGAGATIRPSERTITEALTGRPLPSGGYHVVAATVGGDDPLPADNRRWRVVDVASKLRILLVEGDRGAGAMAGSGAFLALALAPPGADVAGGGDIAADRIGDLEMSGRILGDYRAVVVANVARIQPAQADALVDFARGGGTIVWFMGEAVSADNYNQVLAPRGLLPGTIARRVSAADGEGFRFDFNPRGVLHPLLDVFRGEERSGLDTARVFTYLKTDVAPDKGVERVLDYRAVGSATRPDGAGAPVGDPAITVQPLGAGRVVFMSTTANADWTSFPAKPAYVTLMNELLLGTMGAGDRWMNLEVGQRLEPPESLALSAAPTLLDDQRRPVAITQVADAGGARRFHSASLVRAGVYHLNTGSADLPIAVNVPPGESDVRTLDERALRAALGDVEMDLFADALPSEPAGEQNASDLGWAVLACVLGLTAFESFAAMRFGRNRQPGFVTGN